VVACIVSESNDMPACDDHLKGTKERSDAEYSLLRSEQRM
jgi:hypothetical protein